MDIVKSESDLEDGEIRDDVLEDISDCSISDIIHEGNTIKKYLLSSYSHS